MKQQILSQAWSLYDEYNQSVTLGMCIRTICSQMQHREHKILSKLDGMAAVAYFNEHYSDKYELQYNLGEDL